jgi:hypothetical protein
MWLLPWEDWLPPYVIGPFMILCSILGPFYISSLSWWQLLLLPFTFIYGAYGTWAWFTKRENVFTSKKKDKASSKSEEPQ